jgi:hypothetical protein
MNETPLDWSVDTGPLAHSPADFAYEANAKELDALKRYAGLEDLTAFTARFKISPLSGGKYRASGTLEASAVQASVVNLEAVPSSIEESFSVEYWPAESIPDADPGAPLEADPPEAIVAGHIPIGLLLCELFVLSLDPYPRNPEDKFEWTPPPAGADVSPFAGLAQLKTHKTPEEK